jgi:Dyp-type peroxidase family
VPDKSCEGGRDLMARPLGVLPNSVIRDPRADATFVFANLRDLDLEGLEHFLRRITELEGALCAKVEGQAAATVAIGLGTSFFTRDGQPRFGLAAEVVPMDLRSPPVVPQGQSAPADIVFYIMSTAESLTAEFLRGLSATGALASVTVERGFQRRDRRELSGFLDGLRNPDPSQREVVALVDRGEAPDEPEWCEDGAYMAYLKIPQALEQFEALSQADREAIIGRKLEDGSRLDTPGVSPHDEPEFTGNQPPKNAHVRKVGPRGQMRDRTAIFRRGVPFVTLKEDGTIEAGLQFVSFQRSLDYFDVMLNRWMFNPAFPDAGSGADRLFDEGHATIQKFAFFFIPAAHTNEFVGRRMLPADRRPRERVGRVAIRKRALDAAGQPAIPPVELGGISFQLFNQDGIAASEPFITDSAGHALSPEVPRGASLILRETPPTGFAPVEDRSLTIDSARVVVHIDNRPQSGGYT